MNFLSWASGIKKCLAGVLSGLLCICMSLSFSQISTLPAEASSKGVNATPLEYKIAKNFSARFCEALEDGLNSESAGEIATNETYKVFLSPSFWASAIFKSTNPLDDINSEDIDQLAKSMLRQNCRLASRLSDEDLSNALNSLDELDDKLAEQANLSQN